MDKNNNHKTKQAIDTNHLLIAVCCTESIESWRIADMLAALGFSVVPISSYKYLIPGMIKLLSSLNVKKIFCDNETGKREWPKDLIIYTKIEDINMNEKTRENDGNKTKCDSCNGTGVLHGGPGNYPYTCPKCNGNGFIRSDGNRPPLSTDH